MPAAHLLPVAQFQFPISILFTDVDDTLTWQGRLPVAAFTAMDQLQRAGIRVVPVTGACAGWCDCMIRTWPIDTVIGENGAFWMTRTSQGHIQTHYRESLPQRQQNNQAYQQVIAAFQQKFTTIPMTQDQAFRRTDIAFDIGQETTVTRDIARSARDWLVRQGLEARLSSIHINAWYGHYSKADTAQAWLKATTDTALAACAFIGDSPNDDSMFTTFIHTVGVANIAPFISELAMPPRYVCTKPGGHGFAELAEQLLAQSR